MRNGTQTRHIRAYLPPERGAEPPPEPVYGFCVRCGVELTHRRGGRQCSECAAVRVERGSRA